MSAATGSGEIEGTGERWLLVTDVDETLTGDDAALSRFIDAVNRSPRLLVALNSSRPFPSVEATLAEFPGSFEPDATITAMGTEIRVRGEPTEAWADRFRDWDRTVIDRVMDRLRHPPHAPELQTPWKASFAIPAGADQERASEALTATGLPIRIIRSGESDFDVLPAGAGKDHATLFLADHLGIDRDRLAVAGDSANDLAMFRTARKGIVVANAREELRGAVDPKRVVFADRPRAEGVLEGLVRWGAPIVAPEPESG
jgi:sucrose-6F-phosphate phosphohydrolase